MLLLKQIQQVVLMLYHYQKKQRKKELEEDTIMSQALETYIPLKANNYTYTDNDDNQKKGNEQIPQQVTTLQ
ncbi:hypothetical protein RFI_16857 [Reticulomyxa filosa]|uniref:Uncharacterized protein n=1 Tax=Reticulomyxa filosa TaxID=46433 RepID=X6N2T7_RETFI|nr:hypothetical protein RFI_16857 [Reticulomyxa filosa]|eukprot:ETO20361.1 hypothetical protein RFI_16857 [Reticulomyxa filosa]